MKNEFDSGTFQIRTSFRHLKNLFEEQKESTNSIQRLQAEWALKVFEEHPALVEGFDNMEDLSRHQEPINELMSFLFQESLTSNEIKSALNPLSSQSFYDSQRMLNLKQDSVDGIHLDFLHIYEESTNFLNLMPYSIILNKYYKYQIDFNRPITVPVELKNGDRKVFRITYNGDFISIQPNENAIEITEEILDKLLNNTHDRELWDYYFPKESWRVEGFGLLTMVDVTLDDQINGFKEHLIGSTGDFTYQTMQDYVRKILNIPDLYIGTTMLENELLVPGYDGGFPTIMLSNEESCEFDKLGCKMVKEQLLKHQEIFIIPNIELYAAEHPENRLRQNMLKNGLKSLALIPLVIDGRVQSIIEIGGYEKNQINEISIVKIDDILPFVKSYAKRSLHGIKDKVNAIIQEECTSIHPAVKWKFEEEAYRFLAEQQGGKNPIFQEIVFEKVYPLYGQIDIVGSSAARNEAIQHDLKALLKESVLILEGVTVNKNMPFYEQLLHEAKRNLSLVENAIYTNTEQIISNFFEMRILPVLKYFAEYTQESKRAEKFLNSLDENQTIYHARKQYDATIDAINQGLAQFLDEKQDEAQAIFPHYFQKYKTDGVEHDLYVGPSINKDHRFHESALYNLRMWQMQIMCEMEARYYAMQENYPINLKVASLIFAYDSPMSIRYRIDEKKFDVDGAYNVRYEMIKKRIDKAHIKNTNERLTQPNKLVVVYSNSNIEREYMSYFKFLQAKGYVGPNLEIVELEDLQDAVGLKAIRADINLNLKEEEEFYSLEQVKVKP
ncbi:hypothetical protein NLM59_07270 [Weeksellaceae bacterium KMM 9724]|uniref:hypothetical protein n=1 Tax=Profundicola chukchiensis TaxID=2961959 RepID=UPI0024377887|nr:hypothetical protein [Profundicola chukchiensis]MDG4950720.1 hypothetical protein [Profundicola chukchiensis]